MAKVSANTRFLILDDDAPTRKVIKESLRQIGLKGPFFETDDISVAKEILDEQLNHKNEPVNIILCDWEMPKGTGQEFLLWVRGSEQYSELPFIMITSVNDKAKIMEAITDGVSNYLLKPFSSNELLRKLIAVLEN